MPQRRVRVVPKYIQEACGTYGVACPIINGVEAPQFMETKDYTGRKGFQWRDGIQKGNKKFAYRRESKYRGWNGYDWESKFRESPRMRKYRWVSYQWINNGNNIISHLHPSCIEDLTDHIISKGNRIFANTPQKDTWKIKRRRADTESEKKPSDCTARKYCTTTPRWSISTSWLKIWRKGKVWVSQ